MLIVFDDMIEKLNPVVTELFIRGRKPNLIFITQSYLALLKNITLNSAYCFVMKTTNK